VNGCVPGSVVCLFVFRFCKDARLLIVGDRGAGKSTVAAMLGRGTEQTQTQQQSGNQHSLFAQHLWNVDETLSLNVWDFEGCSCRDWMP
jgi:ATPase subunit of ABC transporter with duplicated ATPase domains